LKLSLDTRRREKDNYYPIILILSHLRKITSINLGHSIQQEYWDEKNQKVKKTFKGVTNVNKFSNQLKVRSEKLLLLKISFYLFIYYFRLLIFSNLSL